MTITERIKEIQDLDSYLQTLCQLTELKQDDIWENLVIKEEYQFNHINILIEKALDFQEKYSFPNLGNGTDIEDKISVYYIFKVRPFIFEI